MVTIRLGHGRGPWRLACRTPLPSTACQPRSPGSRGRRVRASRRSAATLRRRSPTTWPPGRNRWRRAEGVCPCAGCGVGESGVGGRSVWRRKPHFLNWVGARAPPGGGPVSDRLRWLLDEAARFSTAVSVFSQPWRVLRFGGRCRRGTASLPVVLYETLPRGQGHRWLLARLVA